MAQDEQGALGLYELAAKMGYVEGHTNAAWLHHRAGSLVQAREHYAVLEQVLPKPFPAHVLVDAEWGGRGQAALGRLCVVRIKL